MDKNETWQQLEQQAGPGDDPLVNVLMELRNRMESIEQDVAVMKGEEQDPDPDDDVEVTIDPDAEDEVEEEDEDPDAEDEVEEEEVPTGEGEPETEVDVDEGDDEDEIQDIEEADDEDDMDEDEVEELVASRVADAVEQAVEPLYDRLGVSKPDNVVETPVPANPDKRRRRQEDRLADDIIEAAEQGDAVGVKLALQDAAYGGDE